MRTVTGWIVAVLALGGLGCGGGAHAPDAAPDGSAACARGDDCDVAANTGCDDDDRCAVIRLGTCFFPACEGFGSVQAGGACSAINNEGAEQWDDCGPTMTCYRGICTQACELSVSNGGCTAPAQCRQDPDVGAFALGVCR